MPPCTAWVSGDDVADCCSVASTSGFEFDAVAIQASDLLFELSGRLFPGLCSKTVRPPCDSCWCGYQVLSRGHVVGPWDWGGWYPDYLCGTCLINCQPSMVKLSGYPVREITEVKIDGVAIAATEYRLDKMRWLVRTDDNRWPLTQDLTLADTEDGTWSVSYTYGADPPAAGIAAAAQLGCELYKACNGEQCALPKGTTRVTRQGVTIDKLAFTTWAFVHGRYARSGRSPGWQTGMPLVDAFLAAYNPAGLMRRPVFWAPGHRQYPQRLGA